MARFDVYANPDASERAFIPLWDGDSLSSKVADLNPEFEIAGRRVVMDTPALGAIPAAILKQAVGNLTSKQLAIQNALNTLLGGF
jgi:toxin CcdB